MKKHLLLIFLAVILPASISVAGMKMRGNVAKMKPNGEVARAEFYGDIVRSRDGVVSKALVQAKGQTIFEKADGELELRTASPISVVTATFVGMKFGDKVKTFRITPDTDLCDYNRRKIDLSIFRIGDMATVSSDLDETTAYAIRRGPIYFTGVMAGTPELKDIGCRR
ncbi:MAG: hypothetical protein V3V95_00535 [Thermodesulfobacteriota bacterium]